MFTPAPPTLNAPAPAAPVTVGAPAQAFTTFGVAAITTPAGRLSLNVRPARTGAPAGFAIVKVSVEAWPTPIVTGANALVRVARGCTVRPELVTVLVMRAVAPMFAAVLL